MKMKKVKLLLVAALASFTLSCGDDNPLKKCASCTEDKTSIKQDDYCGNVAAVETYVKTMESQGFTCVKK
jgi:hypothetical protein